MFINTVYFVSNVRVCFICFALLFCMDEPEFARLPLDVFILLIDRLVRAKSYGFVRVCKVWNEWSRLSPEYKRALAVYKSLRLAMILVMSERCKYMSFFRLYFIIPTGFGTCNDISILHNDNSPPLFSRPTPQEEREPWYMSRLEAQRYFPQWCERYADRDDGCGYYFMSHKDLLWNLQNIVHAYESISLSVTWCESSCQAEGELFVRLTEPPFRYTYLYEKRKNITVSMKDLVELFLFDESWCEQVQRFEEAEDIVAMLASCKLR